MRHKSKVKKLGRTKSHREAMLNNLVTSLFEHGQVKTTLPKAKEARKLAERLITKAKKDDLNARRYVLRFVKRKEIMRKLFSEIAPKYKDVNGGYTRIVRIGKRRGDAAEEVLFSLVDFESQKEETQN